MHEDTLKNYKTTKLLNETKFQLFGHSALFTNLFTKVYTLNDDPDIFVAVYTFFALSLFFSVKLKWIAT
jgi:hypothetical protein